MTTVAVLVSIDNLTYMFGDHWTHLNLNEYVVYKIKPFLNLHIFSYYDFEKIFLAIDGRTTPKHLQEKITTLRKEQLLQIKLKKANLPKFHSLEELCENKNGTDLLGLLAGKFNEMSIFYNTITGSSYIDLNTIKLIKDSPQKYILTGINLHK